jgi:hypothetical protein
LYFKQSSATVNKSSLVNSLSAIINTSPPNERNDSGTPLDGQIWVTPRSVLAYFFVIINKSQHSKTKFSEFKALATDMALSTPYIKAGIDLFFLFKQTMF